MKSHKLKKEISILIKIATEKLNLYKNNIIQSYEIDRLLLLKSAIKKHKFDAIEFRDILEIDLFDCKSYAELRQKKIDNYKLIKGFNNLSICIFNKENNFKGEYIYLN